MQLLKSIAENGSTSKSHILGADDTKAYFSHTVCSQACDKKTNDDLRYYDIALLSGYEIVQKEKLHCLPSKNHLAHDKITWTP